MEGEMKKKLLVRVEEEEEEVGGVSVREQLWEENKKIWAVAGPAIFTRLTLFGVTTITQAFVGHIGPLQFAAYNLILTALMRFAVGILLGMASALETLCGQAYGAKQYHMLGIYLQRSWIVLTMSAICLLPIFIFSGPILRALGQDEDIIKMANHISYWFIPSFFSFVLSFTCQIYLQAQSKNVIISYLAALTLIIHLLLSWLFTSKLHMGLTGILISTNLAYWIPNVGQLLFVLCGACPDTWKGFSLLAFQDLWPVFKLSLSSGVMLCLELWYNAALVLLTGMLKNAQVAIDALGICTNINGLEMMISIGFLAAASVRVSNELGRGSSKSAKFSIKLIVLTSFLIGFVLFLIFLFARGKLAYIFTTNHEVMMEVANLSPLLATSILLNSIQPVLSGVAVGAGWQSIVAYVNIACYYLVGIPIGILLGYVVGMQVKGVWIGMLLGVFVQTIVLSIITYKTNWEEEVFLARTRLKKWFVEEPSDQQQNNDVQNV